MGSRLPATILNAPKVACLKRGRAMGHGTLPFVSVIPVCAVGPHSPLTRSPSAPPPLPLHSPLLYSPPLASPLLHVPPLHSAALHSQTVSVALSAKRSISSAVRVYHATQYFLRNIPSQRQEQGGVSCREYVRGVWRLLGEFRSLRCVWMSETEIRNKYELTIG